MTEKASDQMSELRPDWAARALSATHGTLTGAILHVALRSSHQWPATVPLKLVPPFFQGRSITTSDGYVLCNYVTRDGDHEPGAFIGSLADLDANVAGLARHLNLNETEERMMWVVMNGWLRRPASFRPEVAKP